MRLNKTQAVELGNALLDAAGLIEEGAQGVTIVRVGSAFVAIGDLEADIAWARIDPDTPPPEIVQLRQV